MSPHPLFPIMVPTRSPSSSMSPTKVASSSDPANEIGVAGGWLSIIIIGSTFGLLILAILCGKCIRFCCIEDLPNSNENSSDEDDSSSDDRKNYYVRRNRNRDRYSGHELDIEEVVIQIDQYMEEEEQYYNDSSSSNDGGDKFDMHWNAEKEKKKKKKKVIQRMGSPHANDKHGDKDEFEDNANNDTTTNNEESGKTWLSTVFSGSSRRGGGSSYNNSSRRSDGGGESSKNDSSRRDGGAAER